ncbi:DUF3795 domain-containing protein [Carboxylicivirga sp. N1Y90]|uniref:DUF3795 domain-containing protein n=1 Tax=Carboxylicivirga fragile TaxID=3417571 RepID=UPI003D357723|nr:DUF3795 domain-containing protein [Marinilabiliaceae bacterium N1Y90]
MVQELKYQSLIAACGMNCGLCIGYLRDKNPSGGCFKKDDLNKPGSCRNCVIVNCKALAKTTSGFCYECGKYPCSRLKRLNTRYRTKYGMSMLDNLNFITGKGMQSFLENEQSRWACENCGAGLSVHRPFCLECKAEVKK